ncbi:hypothetical protein DAEQUDRAFT_767360 [Daedalea quercina L-15889]|uniref:Uncharacterized protein n=1 Tax=Daedalea quercina L-15889 TaxID=1314783 RepID=A0A165NS67_9APHY|nr:hypothetical protein DAEQUDRAFT_767360 [Daedalea quercina L-15889]
MPHRLPGLIPQATSFVLLTLLRVMVVPWDIYTNKLLKMYTCYGFPLWNLRPDLGSVSIGDVGHIEDGQFDCLFNTITHASRWVDELPNVMWSVTPCTSANPNPKVC